MIKSYFAGPTCPGSDEVLCSDNSKCILRKQVCDGKPQCQDASDEESGCKDRLYYVALWLLGERHSVPSVASVCWNAIDL